MARPMRYWTPERLKVMREEYETNFNVDILIKLNNLPGPTIPPDAVRRQAFVMGIVRKVGRIPNVWTPERVEYLQVKYKTGLPSKDLLDDLNALPGKRIENFRLVIVKANNLGIVRTKRPRRAWTIEREDYLRANYASKHNYELLEALNKMAGVPIKNEQAVGIKARQMDLDRDFRSKKPDRAWTDERLEFIKYHWPRNELSTDKIIEALEKIEGGSINFKTTVYKQAMRMGIQRPLSRERIPPLPKPPKKDKVIKIKAPKAKIVKEVKTAPSARWDQPVRVPPAARPVADEATAREDRASVPVAHDAPPDGSPEGQYNFQRGRDMGFRVFPGVHKEYVDNTSVADDAMEKKYAKVREYLRQNKEPFAISNWVRLPLREVYRIQAEMRRELKSA